MGNHVHDQIEQLWNCQIHERSFRILQTLYAVVNRINLMIELLRERLALKAYPNTLYDLTSPEDLIDDQLV